ncbi:MAG: ester cyclase [Spirosomataceae bacterium]
MKRILSLLALLTLGIDVQAQFTHQNKQIATRYFEEVINQQKVELIPQLFADEFVYYDLHSFAETKDNVKDFQEVMRGFFKAFPDAHYTIKNMIAEGDKVSAEITLTATHKGEFMGIPATNKSLKVSETYLFILKNQKIIESRRLVDFAAFFEQIK